MKAANITDQMAQEIIDAGTPLFENVIRRLERFGFRFNMDITSDEPDVTKNGYRFRSIVFTSDNVRTARLCIGVDAAYYGGPLIVTCVKVRHHRAGDFEY